MKKNIIRFICLVTVVLIGLMPLIGASADDRGYRYVKTGNGKSVNLRSDAWKGDNIIARIPYRAYVLVYQKNADKTWSYVEVDNPNGGGTLKGWIQSSFLVSKDPGAYKAPDNNTDPETITTIDDINRAAKAIKVLDNSYFTVMQTKKAANYVHLRMFPDTNAVYTGAYLCDTEIEVLAQSKTWAQVRIVEDGKVGFILRRCVTPVDEN